MQVSIDPGLLGWLLLTTIGIVAAMVGIVAAIEVTRQARGSRPAEADPKWLLPPANRLSMTVSGVGRICDPLNLRFVLGDPAVTLWRIELPNPLDRGSRTAPCLKAETTPKIFMAAVEPKVIERWYNANAYWEGETKKLPICVFFRVGGQAGCMTIWVTISPIKLQSSGLSNAMDFAWFVEGPCSRAILTPASMLGRTGTERR